MLSPRITCNLNHARITDHRLPLPHCGLRREARKVLLEGRLRCSRRGSRVAAEKHFEFSIFIVQKGRRKYA